MSISWGPTLRIMEPGTRKFGQCPACRRWVALKDGAVVHKPDDPCAYTGTPAKSWGRDGVRRHEDEDAAEAVTENSSQAYPLVALGTALKQDLNDLASAVVEGRDQLARNLASYLSDIVESRPDDRPSLRPLSGPDSSA